MGAGGGFDHPAQNHFRCPPIGSSKNLKDLKDAHLAADIEFEPDPLIFIFRDRCQDAQLHLREGLRPILPTGLPHS